MQSTRYHRANPNLKINTDVSGTAAAPEVVFKLIDDTEVSMRVIYILEWREYCRACLQLPSVSVRLPLPKRASSSPLLLSSHSLPQMRFDSQSYTASEILFDVHLNLDKLDNEFEMSGKSLDEK